MKITRQKKDVLRKSYIDGCRDEKYLARKLGLQEATVRMYLGHFERIEREQPDKLTDFDFFIGTEGVYKTSAEYNNLMGLLPELLATEKGPVIVARALYRKYQAQFPGEYSEPRFFFVNTSASPYAKLQSVDMGNVIWAKGFWADRFKVCRDSMIPNLWRIYTDPKIGHATQNFEIAEGLDTGSHVGPPFQDGDFYKLFEAMAAMYAVTKDPNLDALMDKTIALFAKSQR